MKKLIPWSLPIIIAIPALGLAATCTPYKDVVYALQANRAHGTATKSQTCMDGKYIITSRIDVKKGLFHEEITQKASGTYDASGSIVARDFVIDNGNDSDNAALPTGAYDTLSFAMYLGNTVQADKPSFPVTPLLYNKKIISVRCTADKSNASASTVSCATDDKSVALTYTFSVNGMLDAASVFEDGESVMTMRLYV